MPQRYYLYPGFEAMELRHLRYFIAVAEELNFSRAAQRLHVSQPPLSRQIRDLEFELNVKLFERNRQEVKLTKVGRALLARARELIRNAEALRTQADKMVAEDYAELQLGYAPAPTAAIIAGILSRYHELAPGAPVTLHDLSLSEILTGLKAKKLHAGLTLRPRAGEMRGLNPSFSTGGVDDPGNRSRTISWSKGLPHKSDILALTQKLSARADARRRLGRQGEVQLFEQESVIGFGMGVAA